MCRRVRCEVCNKPTYSGCGRHVEEVLGNIAQSDRCTCRNGAKSIAIHSNGHQAPLYAATA
jgi:hypothetical protein